MNNVDDERGAVERREGRLDRTTRAVIAIVGIALGVLFLLLVPSYLAEFDGVGKTTEDGGPTVQQVEASRRTLIQVLGGIAVVIGLWMTYRRIKALEERAGASIRQIQVTEQGQVTERYTKAIAQLGHEQVQVRLGGVYALERIAHDDADNYHWTVIEVLCAFVRQKSPVDASKETQDPAEEDVQAALKVIGRRERLPHLEQGELNLTRVNATGSDLRESNFEGANLSGSRLDEANLSNACLLGANFQRARLSGADFYNANLEEADFGEAELDYANLTRAALDEAVFIDAWLPYASFFNATGLTAEQLTKADDLTNATLSQDLSDELHSNHPELFKWKLKREGQGGGKRKKDLVKEVDQVLKKDIVYLKECNTGSNR